VAHVEKRGWVVIESVTATRTGSVGIRFGFRASCRRSGRDEGPLFPEALLEGVTMRPARALPRTSSRDASLPRSARQAD
jgi:hypothetical protein